VNLPNALTTLRIALAPVTALLLLQPGAASRLVAMAVFLIAALSDLADGALARRRGEITDFGKLWDPIADKLLLVATLIPFYVITRGDPQLARIPLFGNIGLWILVIFFGREIVVTWLRTRAAQRGTVIAARRSGKYKAFAQNVFIGSMILWLAYRSAVVSGQGPVPPGPGWNAFHGWFTSISLFVAILLTVFSFFVYLRAFRAPARGAGG
jgi:CDP-diacylglycerol--glycerol-3-phosphate 3-phosphatidyltransferase